ncbi:MAG: immune inhibitor A [Lentisphaeria bacterium]|nr:immune inhibitor A [Candidatus Neomarinimicrobiota bacterium]MCF7841508.1 immune inhibitor A [Lentisphaeria bacterium]
MLNRLNTKSSLLKFYRPLLVVVLVIVGFARLSAAEMRYQWVRVWITSQQELGEIVRLGFEQEGARVKQQTFVEGVATASAVTAIRNAGFRLDVMEPDMAADNEARLLIESPSREFGYGSMGGYYTYAEVGWLLDSLHAAHPDLVSEKISIGQSVQGRDIWAFKLSDNVDVDEDEPEVFYNALIHAREPAAMMTVLYYVFQLVDGYATNPEYKYLVDNRELWFVPIVNPDGYVYNETHYPDGGGMHRKNLQPGCASTPGVDLNRNFGYLWGFDDTGSSPNACSETYRGTAAFSEPETQALRDFTLAHDFTTVFNYHTYSDLLIMPFGYAVGAVPEEPDYSIYMALGADLTAENGYLFGTGDETVGYLTNGDAVDWMYGSEGIINFTPEVGGFADGGFWPPAGNIEAMELENLSANIHLALVAGHYLVLDTLAFTGVDGFLDPSGTYGLNMWVRNKGFETSTGESQEIFLTSPDGSLALADSVWTVDSINPMTTIQVANSNTGIAVTAGYGEQAILVVSIPVSGEYVRRDTLTWMVGTPNTIFADDAENGMSWWTSQSWGVTSDAFSGDYAFTDSPAGDYPNSAELFMYLDSTIDLSQTIHPLLTFKARWDVEANWDFVQVLGSADDGTTWEPLAGEFTVPGNGESAQPLGEPGYHGEQIGWVDESLDLSPFAASSSFRLAFVLRSDNYVSGDGFVVDDIAVHGWHDGTLISGDINADGLLNVQDVLLVVAAILQENSLTPPQVTAADQNDDGLVNVLDLVLLVDRILS